MAAAEPNPERGTAPSAVTEPLIGPVTPPELHIMSWNVRRRVSYPNPRRADRWKARAPRIRALLQHERPTILGAQELLADQAVMVEEALGPDYRFVGHGRGVAHDGEGTPIFYDASRLRLLDWEQRALSSTPDRPASRTWGNIHPRTLVVARFQDPTTAACFAVLNTHLDHISRRSREQSARVIAQRVSSAADPVIVTGDLNSGAGAAPMRMLTHESLLVETWRAAPVHRTDEWDTLANYRVPRRTGRRIDWILASPGLGVDAAAVNARRYGGGWGSDHLPVQAKLRL